MKHVLFSSLVVTVMMIAFNVVLGYKVFTLFGLWPTVGAFTLVSIGLACVTIPFIYLGANDLIEQHTNENPKKGCFIEITDKWLSIAYLLGSAILIINTVGLSKAGIDGKPAILLDIIVYLIIMASISFFSVSWFITTLTKSDDLVNRVLADGLVHAMKKGEF